MTNHVKATRVSGAAIVLGCLCLSTPVAAQTSSTSLPSLVSSITIGGSGNDTPSGIVVDDAGYAYIAGKTDSVDFPVTASALQTNRQGSTDGFLIKLAPDGRTVVFATYLGGNGSDQITRVMVDGSSAVYVAVESTSTDYPGAQDQSCSNVCYFITKLSPDGRSVIYSRKSTFPLQMVATEDGTVYLTTSEGSFPCFGRKLYAMTPAGELTNALLSRGDCEVGSIYRLDAIAAGPPNDYLAMFTDATSPSKSTVRRGRADGSVVFNTEASPGVGSVLALTQGVLGDVYAITVGSTQFVRVSRDGSWQPSAPLQLAREWGPLSSVPAFRQDLAGELHAVFCTALVTLECRDATLDETGAVTSSVIAGSFPISLAVPPPYAFGREGQLFGATGTADITIQQYASVVVADFSGPVQVRFNAPITWSATPIATNVEYKFIRHDPDGWKVVRDWSSTPTYTWIPGYADLGLHEVQVWIRAPGSTNQYDDWRGTAVTVIDGPLPVITDVTPTAEPYHVGEPITWTVHASGGLGVPQYAFHRLDRDGWHLVRPYSTQNSYRWTPNAGDEGSHVLQVWIRNGDSLAQYDAWQGIRFNVEPRAPLVVQISPLGPIPAADGGSITWRAIASGGGTPRQYQFVRLDPDGQWRVGQGYSAVDTYTWRPAFTDAGMHVVQVWVRNADSTAQYDAWASTGAFEVGPPGPLTVNFTAAPDEPLFVNKQACWTAAVSGTSATVEYQFVRLDADGWRIARPYFPSSTYCWIPQSSDAGTHALQVWARRQGSTATYDGWMGAAEFSVVLIAPLVITEFRALSPPYIGRQAGWTARASGGGAAWLYYQFWRLDADGWHLAQDYSTNPSYSWTPGVNDAGDHALQVWVRRQGVSEPYETWAGVTFTVTPTPTPNVQIEALGPIPDPGIGATVSWRATASGGGGSYQYRFMRYDDDGWHLVQDYSPNNTYTWSPTASDTGSHMIQVWVRNFDSSALYEAWTGVEFTVPPQPAR